MGAFQALLLAAFLGWPCVLAVPQGGPPDWISDHPSNNGTTAMTAPPGPGPGPPASIPTSMPFSGSMPPIGGPPPPPQSGGPWPSWSTHSSHPHAHPTQPSPSPSWTPRPSPSPGTTSGGILIDTAPIPTAIRTYFVAGRPVVAGGSATVIMGTTYSAATSGTTLYADGVPETVSNAIVGGGGPVGSSTVALGTQSGSPTFRNVGTSGAPQASAGAATARDAMVPGVFAVGMGAAVMVGVL